MAETEDRAVVWVLLKERAPRHPTTDTGAATVVAVYASRDELLARVDRMARANKYPMRKLGENAWIFGPEEDEGFFGHTPVELSAVRSMTARGATGPSTTGRKAQASASACAHG